MQHRQARTAHPQTLRGRSDLHRRASQHPNPIAMPHAGRRQAPGDPASPLMDLHPGVPHRCTGLTGHHPVETRTGVAEHRLGKPAHTNPSVLRHEDCGGMATVEARGFDPQQPTTAHTRERGNPADTVWPGEQHGMRMSHRGDTGVMCDHLSRSTDSNAFPQVADCLWAVVAMTPDWRETPDGALPPTTTASFTRRAYQQTPRLFGGWCAGAGRCVLRAGHE